MNMMETIAKAGLLAVGVLLLLLACQTQEPLALKQFEQAPLNGMVYDYDNRPCARVTVVLDQKWKVETDINGRFYFPPIEAGDYTLMFEKKDYEPVELSFHFHSRMQVFYVKMISIDQLGRKIENAISYKRWKEADALIKRALKIVPDDPVTQYLKASLELKRGNFESAAETILAILDTGHNDLVLLLSLADLYQHKLGNPAAARQWLHRYLQAKEDPEIRKRYEGLE